MATMQVELTEAPSTPLNLKFGVLYAPRVTTPPWVGFRAIDTGVDGVLLEGVDDQGAVTQLFRGPVNVAYARFATHLRMDVAPGDYKPRRGTSKPKRKGVGNEP